MGETERRYTVADAAELLGCDPSSVTRKCSAGKVPEATRTGRSYLLTAASLSWLREHLHLDRTPHGLRKAGVDYSAPAPAEEYTREISGDAQTLTTKSRRIRTLEDALQHAAVDLAVWAVERYVVNRWEMGYKDADGAPGTQALYQVKVWLKRRVAEPYVHAADALLERMTEHAPRYAPITLPLAEDPHLLVVSLHDQHFGKLAWRREVGADYDVEIAERLFLDAVGDILRKSSGYPVERILFPMGSDFLNIDNQQLTTAHGTPQDTDGRLAKIVETASMAVVRAVDALLQVAPVDVEFVPGNHDPVSAWHTARFLAAWYRQCDQVMVNCEPIARKYVAYGQTLIGLTHGADIRLDKLPVIMATEVPQLWAAAEWREWHTGHLHAKRELQFVPVNNHEGVVVRVLPSLCQRDMYHYEHGYIGNRQAEGLLYSKERGPSGYVISVARGNEIVRG